MYSHLVWLFIFYLAFFMTFITLVQVVKLHEDHNFFIPEKNIKFVKRDSSINNTTALARYIVRQVFTKEALQQCSVFGRPSACKGKEAMVCRPALHQDGVQAIIRKEFLFFNLSFTRNCRKGYSYCYFYLQALW